MPKTQFSVRLDDDLIRRIDEAAPQLVAPGMPTPSRSEVIAGLLERALSAMVAGGVEPVDPA